jgi:pimeloyl-ACP methyl ester carboxylesterase
MGMHVGMRINEPLSGMRDVPLQDPALPPVVLLHGFASVARHMAPWVELLEDQATYALGYPSTGDALSVCRWVQERIECISAHHTQPVLLVGHSLGGLLLTAAAACLPADAVKHCITVCSPHGPANLPSTSLDGVRAVARKCDVDKLTTITADQDWIVPTLSAVVPGAVFVLLRDAGHLSAITHHRTLDTISAAAHRS